MERHALPGEYIQQKVEGSGMIAHLPQRTRILRALHLDSNFECHTYAVFLESVKGKYLSCSRDHQHDRTSCEGVPPMKVSNSWYGKTSFTLNGMMLFQMTPKTIHSAFQVCFKN